MNIIFRHFIFYCSLFFLACRDQGNAFDAQGSFESEEVVVSSQVAGQLLTLGISEGDSLHAGQVVGTIDDKGIQLQKQQVEASIQSLSEKTSTVTPQVQLLKEQLAVQQSQLKNYELERGRIARLVAADAATGKQLDDLDAQIDVTRKQMRVTLQQIAVQRTNVGTQNRSILSEGLPLEKQAAQLDDQISKAKITNPINGIVTTRYAEAGEFATPGKALYKIADLSYMVLRAYVSGTQISEIKLNDPVEVFIDSGKDKYRTYRGMITWISAKAEFTPKTIQTKDERANLVYAIKVKVKNDGYVKMGMYGEVKFLDK